MDKTEALELIVGIPIMLILLYVAAFILTIIYSAIFL